MEKEFVPYELTVKLKELGFNEPCFGYWKSKNWLIQEKTRTDGYTHADQECSAPLYQQAFRFFREKYGLSGWVNESICGNSRHGVISIKSEIGLKYYPTTTKFFDTYEEAELECLKKLIKIVKNK